MMTYLDEHVVVKRIDDHLRTQMPCFHSIALSHG